MTDTNKKLWEEVGNAPTLEIQDMLSKIMCEIKAHEKIMVAISGGSDSDILMDAFHRLDPEKKVHYVFFNTGLEYAATKRHLESLEKKYGIEIEWVQPILPIPTCCNTYGVPFWSKRISDNIYRLQRHDFKWEDKPFDVLLREYPECKAALKWWCNAWPKKDNGNESAFNIAYTPWLKEFMVQNPPPMKISKKCCEKAKHGPADRYEKTHNFDMNCTGVRKAEGGQRSTGFKTCFTRTMAGADTFRPLFWLSDQDKQDYKEHYGVVNSDCYEIWGMKRTGCAGCPFGKEFERELELMQKYEPKFYKAALKIFGASYDYTRKYLKFRKKMSSSVDWDQMDLFDDFEVAYLMEEVDQ